MSLDHVREKLAALTGMFVASKSIAGNSLLLHFASAKDAKPQVTVWLDPAWRYERAGRPVVASGDFPVVEADADRPEFERVCELTDDLSGVTLEHADVSLPSHDLSLKLSGARTLLGFALTVQDLDWPNWQLHDLAEELRYRVTVQGVLIESSAA
jgi:hypothetical protein